MNRLETKCLIASAGMHALLVAVLVFGAAFFKDKDADAPKTVFKMFPSDKIAAIASGGNPNGGAKEIKDEPTAPAAPQPAAAPPPPPPPPPAPVQPPPQAQPEPPKPAPEVVKVPVVNPRPTPTKPPKSAAKSEVPHIIETKGKPTDKKTSPTKSETKEAKKSDTKTDNKKPQVTVDLTRHVFNNTTKKQTDPNSKTREQAEKEAQDKADQAARDAWDKQQRIANLKRQTEISGSLRDLQRGLTTSGGLNMEPLGPGNGSANEVYMDYASVVLSAYDRAWLVGNDISDEQSVVKVSVTIARNGDVLSARILRRSGNSLLDRTVQSALDRVKTIAPFPDSTREAEQTFTFTFNLKAKRQSG